MTVLIIDILLWGSLIGVSIIAWRQDKAVLTVALRKGGMDFINIVPRIALGVIGSGFIAAIIPSEVIVGGLGPDTGWLGIATAVVAGAATPGGPVIGFSIGAVALKSGGITRDEVQRHRQRAAHFGNAADGGIFAD